MNDLSFVVRRV